MWEMFWAQVCHEQIGDGWQQGWQSESRCNLGISMDVVTGCRGQWDLPEICWNAALDFLAALRNGAVECALSHPTALVAAEGVTWVDKIQQAAPQIFTSVIWCNWLGPLCKSHHMCSPYPSPELTPRSLPGNLTTLEDLLSLPAGVRVPTWISSPRVGDSGY